MEASQAPNFEAFLDKDIADMTPQERHDACLCAVYEFERERIAQRACVDYMAELCGVTPAELEETAAKAAAAEEADFGEDPEPASSSNGEVEGSGENEGESATVEGG